MDIIIQASLYIIFGLVLLSFAADRFVMGASAIARYYGISPLLIGLTIVALGTSAPEIFVAINAALRGSPGLAIGNAIGSNIANIGLVLGTTALLCPLSVHSKILRREYPILFLIMLLVWVLMIDGDLSRWDGGILIVGLSLLMGWLIRAGINEKNEKKLTQEFADEIPEGMSITSGITWFVIGCTLLPISSQMLVNGAVTIAHYFGVSDLIIGLTIVAIGTSLPEVAASIAAALKNEGDMAIGNILGSNMFNMLAVLPFPGLIHPGTFERDILTRDLPMMFVITIFLFITSYGYKRHGTVMRWEGFILILLYVGYIGLLLK